MLDGLGPMKPARSLHIIDLKGEGKKHIVLAADRLVRTMPTLTGER